MVCLLGLEQNYSFLEYFLSALFHPASCGTKEAQRRKEKIPFAPLRET
jgi:hypothetical protein